MIARLRLASLFMLSIALIAFELGIMRVFAVGNWSNFGNLIISTALLGFGLSGAVLTFLQKSVEKHGDSWLFGSSLVFMAAMPISQVLAQLVPFEATFMGSDATQFLWIGLYYIIYGIPFVAGAVFIGVSFVVLSNKVHQLYFWNMAGSGLGGFFVIVCMFFLPPDWLVLPVMVLALLATVLASIRPGLDGSVSVPTFRFGLSLGVAVVALVLLGIGGQIRVSEFKPISYVQKFPADKVDLMHHSVSPAGEYHVYKSSLFHFAPGLSDNASLNVEAFPTQPFWALYIDGSGPIGIMGALEAKSAGYVDYLPMAAPYQLHKNPRVLLVNLGGGINAQVAKYKGASSITISEQNPQLISLMRDDPAVSEFTGHLLDDKKVNLVETEARAYLRSTPNSYDIVEISLIDSIGLSDSGGYSVHENYTYTVEAIKDYLLGLTDEGLLSITVWNSLSPPRNVMKLLSTITTALKEAGVADPAQHIFMFDQLRSTATILIKKTAYTQSDLQVLRGFVDQNSFNMIYHHGIDLVQKDFWAMVGAFRTRLTQPEAEVFSDFTPSELYQLAIVELLKGNGDRLYNEYIFDIRPMTDNRPYYSGYLKLNELGMYLSDVKEISEEWGYLLLLGILLQAIFFGLIVIFLPVVGRWKSLFSRQKGKTGVIIYFASLGLSYMLVEIFLIQRLYQFLGNPIFSVSIVITAMLIISGIGNLVSSKISPKRVVRVRIAVVGIVLSIVFYMFGLGPLLELSQSSSLLVRILLSVVFIAPAAFFMGMPYPNGLEALTEKRPNLLPWAWGMNGGLSVAGTALAWILSVSSGFIVLLMIPIVLYIAVGILFPVNELEDKSGS